MKDEIAPLRLLRVMDLVKQAGVNVSDWKNFKGGAAKAAANPKYCYEWAFVERGKVVVINEWLQGIQESPDGKDLFLKGNERKYKWPDDSVRAGRARRMFEAIRTAHSQGLPIRLIILDGQRRVANDPSSETKVTKRRLDDVSWAVTAFDENTGEYVLRRGAVPSAGSSEEDDPELSAFEGEMRKRFIQHRKRERKLRQRKIEAAQRLNGGRLICEVPNCGFEFADCYGQIGVGYAQVHHKELLSCAPAEGRLVTLDDLAIVCANCHVMIHREGGCRPIETLIP